MASLLRCNLRNVSVNTGQPPDLSIQLAADKLLDLAGCFNVRGLDRGKAGQCPPQLVADKIGIAICPSTALL